MDVAKRHAVLDAFWRVACEGRRDGVTLQGVAQAAGVSKGTVYKAFGDLDGLCDAAIERELGRRGSTRSSDEISPLEHPLVVNGWIGRHPRLSK